MIYSTPDQYGQYVYWWHPGPAPPIGPPGPAIFAAPTLPVGAVLIGSGLLCRGVRAQPVALPPCPPPWANLAPQIPPPGLAEKPNGAAPGLYYPSQAQPGPALAQPTTAGGERVLTWAASLVAATLFMEAIRSL